ncbi:MAG: Outer membrane porin protein 32 [Burkholderiaceae bacterium]|nr:Outer membrane porin protein 32 [Burkholderiaceae bacterium]
MKKTLLALAVLGAYAGVASAQSSVTIWGVVDLSINQIKNGDAKTTSMQSNQLNSNRLGFRGTEDLGGGLSAGFHLEGAMSNQDGNAGGLTFQRRSTVSLISQQGGEIRLGRDYDPSFWNLVFFDVYGANGIGQGLNLITTLGSGASTLARTNNSIGYILPGNLGGIYGQAQYALGQGNNNNKYWGARVGYASGPIDVAFGYGQTETNNPDKFKIMNIGASYNLGVAKILGLYNQNKNGALKENFYELSVSVPMGQGEFKAGYANVKEKGLPAGVDADANQWALQYIYNMSKRTALYGGYSQLDNDAASARSILGGTAQSNLAGHKSSGFNVGVRHSF